MRPSVRTPSTSRTSISIRAQRSSRDKATHSPSAATPPACELAARRSNPLSRKRRPDVLTRHAQKALRLLARHQPDEVGYIQETRRPADGVHHRQFADLAL